MKRFAVVGNPNAGKSTLVNTLTGSSLKVGNWHGVTMKREDRSFSFFGEEYVLSDLPGIYSLSSPLAEEGETAKSLREENYDGIIFVAEAKTLPRSIRLLKELKGLGLSIVGFINLYADFSRHGGEINAEKLAENTGVKFSVGEADGKEQCEKFKFAIKAAANKTSPIAYKKGEELCGAYSPSKRENFAASWTLNPFFCALSFIAFVTFSVYLSFGEYGPGNAISCLIGRLTAFLSEKTGEILSAFCSPFIKDLVSKGLICGVGSVAEFLPQVGIMSFFLLFAEQSGFLSHLAAVFDGVLKKFGLSGKAVYTILSGYGCGAVASSVAVGIEDESVKRRAVLSLPFVSCSAKTPVYAFVAKYCFKRYAFLVIAPIYIFSIVFALVHSAVLYKTILKTPPSPLLFELAGIKRPRAKPIISEALKTVKNFAVRLGTVIVISSLALFILSRVTVDFSYAEEGSERTLISYISRAISPLFKPLGIEDERYSAAIITGIFAKEGIVSALSSLFPEGINLCFSSALSFVVFCYAYTPCVSAVCSTAKTVGRKFAFLSALWQLFVAFALSYAVRIITIIF